MSIIVKILIIATGIILGEAAVLPLYTNLEAGGSAVLMVNGTKLDAPLTSPPATTESIPGSYTRKQRHALNVVGGDGSRGSDMFLTKLGSHSDGRANIFETIDQQRGYDLLGMNVWPIDKPIVMKSINKDEGGKYNVNNSDRKVSNNLEAGGSAVLVVNGTRLDAPLTSPLASTESTPGNYTRIQRHVLNIIGGDGSRGTDMFLTKPGSHSDGRASNKSSEIIKGCEDPDDVADWPACGIKYRK